MPGCAYLIGSYYLNREFLTRYTVFLSAFLVAGAFNGVCGIEQLTGASTDGILASDNSTLQDAWSRRLRRYVQSFRAMKAATDSGRVALDLLDRGAPDSRCQHAEFLHHATFPGKQQKLLSRRESCTSCAPCSRLSGGRRTRLVEAYLFSNQRSKAMACVSQPPGTSFLHY